MDLKPPFRADHVGSLLRPPELRAAHESALAGNYAPEALHELQDRCIKAAIDLQESVGLHAITDGEFRRTSFHADFIEKLEGAHSRGSHAATSGQFGPRAFEVSGKLRHSHPIEVDNFRFVAAATSRTAKQTIPSPTIPLRGGREAVSREAYPNFAYLCDAKLRGTFRRWGDDPDEMPMRFARLINAALAGRPARMATAIHLCRGNSAGLWAAEGAYEPVAEVLFNEIDVDAWFLEYDDARSGGFEPLRFFPRGSAKKIVLGLVSSKRAQLESKDDIRRRIDEAAQRRKLELVVEVATEVWGSAR